MRILIIVLLAVTVVTGCSSTPDHTPDDVTFAAGMLPHHQQAITMSDLATTRAASPEVRDLAGRIARGQAPEIDRLNAMLAAWGAPAGGVQDMSGMSGMAGPDEMARLAALSGPAFDRAFLEAMTRHHEGAVAMASTELERGRDAGARELARSVVAAQQAEIAEMRGLLARA